MNSHLDSLSSLLLGDDDITSILANASSFLNLVLEDINWVGFYIYKNNQLVLGPFQGKPACSRLKIGKGVCSKAVELKETVIVADVHEFSGHIACDSASNSEIVIPLIINNQVFAVLDVDSPVINRFSEKEKMFLESSRNIIVDAIIKAYQ